MQNPHRRLDACLPTHGHVEGKPVVLVRNEKREKATHDKVPVWHYTQMYVLCVEIGVKNEQAELFFPAGFSYSAKRPSLISS